MTNTFTSRTTCLTVLLATAAIAVSMVAGAAQAQSDITNLPPVIDTQGQEVPSGIASLERVTLGGVEQTILIRGQSADNPVLLFLHGGPGGAIIPWVEFFHTPLLEENFTVVHWDQRGTGASFNTDLTVEDITVELMISDTLELTSILSDRFDQDKIILAGQSRGSALGFMTLTQDNSPYPYQHPSFNR